MKKKESNNFDILGGIFDLSTTDLNFFQVLSNIFWFYIIFAQISDLKGSNIP